MIGDSYKCNNCIESKKDEHDHSAFSNKCPTYKDAKEKFKLSIPYYKKKLALSSLSKNMQIVCWNVRSLLNKKKLKNFLQIIEDKKIERVCFQD